MFGHDIIVIGGSKGLGLMLGQLASALPASLPAAVFIVVHLPAFPTSDLPGILGRAGPLAAAFAVHTEPISPGRIYVAPPGRHLRIEYGRLALHRGPPEQGHRPAIDPVFRSAAESYGRRVVGVVMSGLLHDGASGLAFIKSRGGVAIVQDPMEALAASMPLHALARVDVDHCVPVGALAPLLSKLATEPNRPELKAEAPLFGTASHRAQEHRRSDEPSGGARSTRAERSPWGRLP